MKYDAQIVELKNLLPSAKNILIALPVGADTDRLAAALSLFLIFEAQGKEVSVVCEDSMRVAQAHLFGVDHVQKTLPQTEGGNLTLTLEGVAASDGTVPALEKLDWYAENNNLNLVFHVLPGQTFQPARIVPRYQGSGFDLIFVIGAANLDSLGSIYRQNAQGYSGVHIVNIDNQNNTGFGSTNVVDTQASSVGEMVVNLILDLGLTMDADVASNLLSGIFASTDSLTNPKVNADTYMAVAQCLRVGGRKPAVSATMPQVQVAPQGPQPDLSALIPSTPIIQQTLTQPTPPASSPEERPAGEGVVSETPEPEWLTPKIFKGTSIG
ncbi:hypothetical protein HYZ06_01475 [Candidatus Daviesbacteria bacterium]|nr:hypothetical protein [Candidatus Daviesbacteria bacterium]